MSLSSLESDRSRFLEIIKSKIRQDLQKFLSSDDFWARPNQGKVVKIKLVGIEIPHIAYGQDAEGVGQGDGNEGDVIGEESPQGPSEGGGGTGSGDHHLEIEFSEDELVQMILEDLELPRLQPKGKKTLLIPTGKYVGVRPVGPDSLRIFKRSYKRALKRTIASGIYSPDQPRIIIEREDKRFRAQKNQEIPFADAILILLRDISGSMDENFNKVVRAISRLFDLWVHHHYKGQVQVRYFLHDTESFEVTQDEFYQMSWGGGTLFSPAYKMISETIDRDHPPVLWNTYFCHFTDGDPFDGDNAPAKEALNELISRTNLTSYFEVGPEEITNQGWGGTYTWKRDKERYFGEKIKEFVSIHAPLFEMAYVRDSSEAYEAFVKVLKGSVTHGKAGN